MVNFDANTPQLKTVKRLTDAYISLDMNNLEPILSKDYQYEALPAIPEVPIQTKESHIQMWKEVYSLVSKQEINYHEVLEAPGKVVLHITSVFSTIFGTTLNYDTLLTYTFVEEDGELKILRCKDFGNPQQRDALIAGTVKAAAERVAA